MASQSHTKKRLAYNASFKLEVVGYAEIHENRVASRKFTDQRQMLETGESRKLS